MSRFNLKNSFQTLTTFFSPKASKATPLPQQRCNAFFSTTHHPDEAGVERIYVINLDKETKRWSDITHQLNHIFNKDGLNISSQTIRVPAINARELTQSLEVSDDIVSTYTLADQLYVDPQPHASPDNIELERPIHMSFTEIAIAQSHIAIWRKIADGDDAYALILEDDIYVEADFGEILENAWTEMIATEGGNPRFDMLYVSFQEARRDAIRHRVTPHIFRPEHGLWFFSGYILSKKGARKLLELLPCRGPIDLWINHQFHKIDVRATSKCIIGQRLDIQSSNSYSVMPTLCRIGVIDNIKAPLFRDQLKAQPVFAFTAGAVGSSSLAMALSMLGYRCCSDLSRLPKQECQALLTGSSKRIFNAYVNIGNLDEHIIKLAHQYPRAKFIVIMDQTCVNNAAFHSLLNKLQDSDRLLLDTNNLRKWNAICEFLECVSPMCRYPQLNDFGQRDIIEEDPKAILSLINKRHKQDALPWITESPKGWRGINTKKNIPPTYNEKWDVRFYDTFEKLDEKRWLLNSDTFPKNLGLCRPANVTLIDNSGVSLTVNKQSLGVREFGAAGISSHQTYVFGKFETCLQISPVADLVTEFALYRDSPRQEISITINGSRPDHMLVNVFYNPGAEGANFNFGDVGTPRLIPLGFNAACGIHSYRIEWDSAEIRWLVDDRLVHRRALWNPTPIPHLAMQLKLTHWPMRSEKLNTGLLKSRLPCTTSVRSISVDATTTGA